MSIHSAPSTSKWALEYPLFLLSFCLPIIPLARIVVNPALGMLKEGVVAFLLIAGITQNLATKMDSIRLPYGQALTFLLTGYVLMHVLVTDGEFSASLESARFMLLYPVMAIALFYGFTKDGVGDGRTERRVRALLRIIFVSAVAVSLIGMYQKYLNPDFVNLYGGRTVHGDYMGLKNIRIISTLENPISLGFFLQVGIVSAYFLFRTAESRAEKVVALAGGLLFCYTAVFTISRSAFLIMGVFALILALKSIVFGSLATKAWTIFGLGMAVVAARSIWVSLSSSEVGILDLLNNRLFELLDSNVLDSDLRIVMWKMKVLPFLQLSIVEILFGKGVGHVGWGGNTFVMENGYLAILYELGIMGLVIFALLWTKAIHNAYMLSIGNSGVGRAYGMAFSLFMVAYLIAMALADVHMNLPLVFYFWLFFALSEAYLDARNNVNPESGSK